MTTPNQDSKSGPSQHPYEAEAPTFCSYCGADLYIVQQEGDDEDPLKDELNWFEFKQYRRTVKSLVRHDNGVSYEKLFGKSPTRDGDEDNPNWRIVADMSDFEWELEDLASANFRIYINLNRVIDELIRLPDPAKHAYVKRVKKLRKTYRVKVNTCSAFFDIVRTSRNKRLIFAMVKFRTDAYGRAIKSIKHCTQCGVAIAPNEDQT